MTLPEWFQSISGMVSLVVYVLTWALIPHVLLQRKQPLATLAWVWSILLFPLIGPLVYLLIGTERIRRRTREGRLSVRNIVRPDRSDDLADFPASSQGAEWNDILRTLSLINRRTATIENSAEFLLDGGEFYPALEDAIRNARHHVHLEFYIWRKDETGRKFLQLLVDAAKRGVEVRLLLDEIGSMWTGRKFFQPLVEAGGKFSWFSTFAPRRGAFHINLRNHRKLVVADGLLAFAGGTNIGDEYISSFQGGPPHRDAQVRLQGPAVTQVARLFAEDWAYSAQETLKDEVYYPECPPMGDKIVQIVAGGPDNDVVELQLSLLAGLNQTRRRVWLTTPYFVPEPTILTALQLAALRGVDVRIVVPRRGNHRYLEPVTHSFYVDLLPYGIRIFEYRPCLMHAKLALIDDLWVAVGSANLDVRSLYLNFEMSLLIRSAPLNQQIAADFDRFFADSDEVLLDDFNNRPFRRKMLEAVCRPLAPLL